MYNAAIIGCGRIGIQFPDSHLQAYLDCEDTRLIALCDANFWRASATAFPWYTDYMDMLANEALDIVSVCTPPETHRKIVCDIAPYVKAIYCEKPIATTLKEADRMIKTCHTHNTILQVNHQRRWMPPKFRFARGILNTGTHAFDRLTQLFGSVKELAQDYIEFENGIRVDLEYTPSDEYIFELDVNRGKEPMILKGAQHLVECLKENKQSISSGEVAREVLRLCLGYRRLTGCD